MLYVYKNVVTQVKAMPIIKIVKITFITCTEFLLQNLIML
jgi:hypothetical protein